mgnify:CR=1 FL=1
MKSVPHQVPIGGLRAQSAPDHWPRRIESVSRKSSQHAVRWPSPAAIDEGVENTKVKCGKVAQYYELSTARGTVDQQAAGGEMCW